MIARLQKLKNKKGFTLVELIVVVAIIAILTAVLVPIIGNYTAQAANTAAAQAAAEVKQAVNVACADISIGGVVIASDSVTKASGVAASGISATNSALATKLQTSLVEIATGDSFTATVVNNACTSVSYTTAGGITVTA